MPLPQWYRIERSWEDGGERMFRLSLLSDSDIYAAHFPGRPITPGACLLQMALELTEATLQRPLEVTEVRNIKFKNIISPTETPEITVVFKSIKPTSDGVSVKAEITNHSEVFSLLSFICR